MTSPRTDWSKVWRRTVFVLVAPFGLAIIVYFSFLEALDAFREACREEWGR